jgi:hypothetical protein
MALYFLLGTLNEIGQKMLLHNLDQMIETIRDCHCQGAQILSQYAVLRSVCKPYYGERYIGDTHKAC